MVVLNEKPKLIGSEEDREKRNEEVAVIRKELLELCTETAQKFLVQGIDYCYCISLALLQV